VELTGFEPVTPRCERTSSLCRDLGVHPRFSVSCRVCAATVVRFGMTA
jgi:hypothetical protein